MKKFHLLTALLCSLLCAAQPDIRTVYAEALEAHRKQDFVTFLRRFQLLDSLNPEHPSITYNLGAAYARNNHPTISMKYAKKALQMNATLQPESDEDFASLGVENLSQLTQLKQKLQAEVRTSAVLFKSNERDLHPESIAFDPSSGDYFLNSVRKGKIIRYSPKSNSFSEFSSGHWAIMGIRVHKGNLWACEVAAIEHEGFDETNEGKSALLQFDLKSGQVLNRYEVSGGHWFGDVLISKSGHVYVSDSRQPMIYILNSDRLEVFQDFTNKLYNLQGLAFSSDEALLYIADYKVGIQALNLRTRTLTKLAHDEEIITKGTDGLYFHNNSLIAIQNGVNPFRISRFYLDASGTSIIRQEYLEKATPELGEPTLGVIVKNSLVFVANSPWGAYNKGIFSSEGLDDNIILQLPLK